MPNMLLSPKIVGYDLSCVRFYEHLSETGIAFHGLKLKLLVGSNTSWHLLLG